MHVSGHYTPSTAILGLDDRFYDKVEAARFPEFQLRFRNQKMARRVGLGELTDEGWCAAFGRFEALPKGLPQPLALRYHGHQFRHYNPALGDGRGFLFAQLLDPKDGRLLDLGTKGSGRTPWSRGGDGRLTLKGGVREVLATEMLEALGVNTSKSFSLFETGEQLYRNDEPSPTRSAVLVRLSHSHVRFGTFERFAHLREPSAVIALLDYCVEHHFPHLEDDPDGVPVAFMREVCARSADLAAGWMTAGFVHGVLNTDNMNVTGESFDYGPYRFAPRFDESFVAAYFDHQGLYAYGDQHLAVIWNLARLAEAISLVAPQGTLADTLYKFLPTFTAAWHRKFLKRLGIAARGEERDEALFTAAVAFLKESGVGLDQFFFDWYGGTASRSRAAESPEASLYDGAAFARFRKLLRRYDPVAPKKLDDPYFQQPRPCALLIDEIEAIWDRIAQDDDWSAFSAKIRSIRSMGTLLSDV